MRFAWRELRSHPTRLGAVILSIMISVGFLVSCLVSVATESNAISRSVTAPTSSSDVVAQLEADPDRKYQTLLAGVPGVAAVEATYVGYSAFSSSGGAGQLTLYSVPTHPRLRWATVTAGTWPSHPDELAVGRTTAREYGLDVGDTVNLARDGESSQQQLMRITGVTDQSRSMFSGLGDSAFVDDSYFARQPELPPPTFLIIAEAATTAEALVTAVERVLPPETYVKTSAAVSEETVAGMTDGVDVFRYLLLAFGAIALLVGSIIIANTFTIVIAQRRRQIGLLRAVGASSRQVRDQVLSESLIIGVVGALLGVGLGVAMAAIATSITGSIADGMRVPAGTVSLAATVGLVVTVLAALAPAARAMRVSPLEALRPVNDTVTESRIGRLRSVIALALIAAGGGVIALGLNLAAGRLIVAIAGSFLLAVGIVLATPTFLPRALRLLGRGAGAIGVTGRLAAANTVRNPARAAATCTALMLAVGLIVTLQVGAASMKSSVNATLNNEFPVDLTITNLAGPLSPEVISAVQGVPGIKATTEVAVIDASVKDGESEVRVAGLRPDAGQVVAAGFGRLNDQVALAHASTLAMLGLGSGEQITVSYHGREATFTLQISDVADYTMVVITSGALADLAPTAPVASLWAAAADRSHAGSVTAGVRKVMAQQPGLALAGSLPQSASVNELLDRLVQVATALLAVAVIIALIGVGNTLGLSVIERTRESALLRALGLQRRQLRMMLAAEAILLALVGALVGIAAGAMFGLIGTAALVQEADMDELHFAMSAPQTLGVVGGTVLAGALASVLPGRRAAQASPTAALAEV